MDTNVLKLSASRSGRWIVVENLEDSPVREAELRRDGLIVLVLREIPPLGKVSVDARLHLLKYGSRHTVYMSATYFTISNTLRFKMRTKWL